MSTNITICREGWYFLVVLAFIIGGAIVREVNLLFVLAGMMFGPLLVSWRMAAVTLRDLKFTRRFPDSISAGEPLLIELVVANERPHVDSWGLVVQDRIVRVGEEDAEPIEVDVRVPHLPAGGSEREAYQGCLQRRGKYRLGPLTIRTRYPLGLMEGSLVEESYDEVIVSPRLGRLTAAWRRVILRSRSGSEQAAHRQGSIEGEFYGIRDWQSGDSQRRVHWRTSARRQKLAVRQFELQHRPDLALVLDLAILPTKTPRLPCPIIERAISFAATIVTDICRRSTGRVVLCIAGRELVIRSGASSTGLVKELTEALAVAEAGDQPQVAPALREAGRHVPPGTTTVLVTTRGAAVDGQLGAGGMYDLARGPLVTIDAASREIDQYFLYDERKA